MAKCSFVIFHFSCHTSHELAARVNLQHLRPHQRALLVNRLKGLCNFSRVFQGQRLSFFVMAGNINNSQQVLVNFATTQKLVVPPIIIAILAIFLVEYSNMFIFSICWKNLLVFKMLVKRDPGRHDSHELFVVHNVRAGISGALLFHHLYHNLAYAGG